MISSKHFLNTLHLSILGSGARAAIVPRRISMVRGNPASVGQKMAAAQSRDFHVTKDEEQTSTQDPWIHYNHNDQLDPLRWTAKECHQNLEDRPWAEVLRFYSLVTTGQLFLSDLFSEHKKHAGSPQRNCVKNWPPAIEASVFKTPSNEAKGGKWDRRTYKIVISYDGSAFVGWQKQPGLFTVQGLIEQALGKFVDGRRAESLEAQGLPVEAAVSVAGRTDKGVHASGQVCSFYTWRRDIKTEEVETAINAVAPKALRVVSVEQVSRTFHPNFSAQWRRYVYILPLHNHEVEERCYGREDLTAASCTLPVENLVDYRKNSRDSREEFPQSGESEVPTKPQRFDVMAVNALLCQLEGHCLSYTVFARDTKTSRSRGAPTECIIYHARAAVAELPAMEQAPGGDSRKVMCVELVANRFLRKMVRVLVATAVREAAAGAPSDSLLQLTSGTCRRASAPPAPACGLCLVEARYDDFAAAKLLIN